MIPLPTSWLPKALRGESITCDVGADEVGEGATVAAEVGATTVGSEDCNVGKATATDVTATALVAAKILSAVGIEN